MEGLSRLLSYVLGYRPDEFGLVPDPDGFLTCKDLLWAFHEEEGWRHVREGHIREALIGKGRSLFDWDEDRIRAVERHWHLDLQIPVQTPPKMLYTPVRRRAHAHAVENGLRSERPLLLTPDREMALRIGCRRDQRPVLLEILTAVAQEEGVLFYRFGDLYLADSIPTAAIAGPPVPKEALQEREGRTPEKAGHRQTEFSPGTFVLDAGRDPDPFRRSKGKGGRGWKEEVRRSRRRREI